MSPPNADGAIWNAARRKMLPYILHFCTTLINVIIGNSTVAMKFHALRDYIDRRNHKQIARLSTYYHHTNTNAVPHSRLIDVVSYPT